MKKSYRQLVLVIALILIAFSFLPIHLPFAIIPISGSGANINWSITDPVITIANDFRLTASSDGSVSNLIRINYDGYQTTYGHGLYNMPASMPPAFGSIIVPQSRFINDNKTGKVLIRIEHAKCTSGEGLCAGWIDSQENHMNWCQSQCQPGSTNGWCTIACWTQTGTTIGGSPIYDQYNITLKPLAWSHLATVELWVDREECVLTPTSFVGAETFGPGSTVTVQSFRVTPESFCSQLPILVTEAGRDVNTKIEEYQTLQDSYITVPAGQTWTFFYIGDLSKTLEKGCPVGFSYDVALETCKPIPGVIWFCSDGILDPVDGFCHAGPEPCEKGYYDTSRNMCVYQLGAGETSVVCPNRNLTVETDTFGIERCVFGADPYRLCGKGFYDSIDKVCKFVPQPIPDNIWNQLALMWNGFWAWLIGLLGW